MPRDERFHKNLESDPIENLSVEITNVLYRRCTKIIINVIIYSKHFLQVTINMDNFSAAQNTQRRYVRLSYSKCHRTSHGENLSIHWFTSTSTRPSYLKDTTVSSNSHELNQLCIIAGWLIISFYFVVLSIHSYALHYPCPISSIILDVYGRWRCKWFL